MASLASVRDEGGVLSSSNDLCQTRKCLYSAGQGRCPSISLLNEIFFYPSDAELTVFVSTTAMFYKLDEIKKICTIITKCLLT